ncbi:MAG: hypothetical protein RLZZ623_1100, partial [Actinomycetota bacterium]
MVCQPLRSVRSLLVLLSVGLVA